MKCKYVFSSIHDSALLNRFLLLFVSFSDSQIIFFLCVLLRTKKEIFFLFLFLSTIDLTLFSAVYIHQIEYGLGRSAETRAPNHLIHKCKNINYGAEKKNAETRECQKTFHQYDCSRRLTEKNKSLFRIQINLTLSNTKRGTDVGTLVVLFDQTFHPLHASMFLVGSLIQLHLLHFVRCSRLFRALVFGACLKYFGTIVLSFLALWFQRSEFAEYCFRPENLN